MKIYLSLIVSVCLLFITDKLKAQEGTLESTFGSNGVLYISGGTNDELRSVVVQPDGKFIVGGSVTLSSKRRFYINRYSPTGFHDPQFYNTDSALTFISQNDFNFIEGLALQDDGTIIYGGHTGSGQSATAGKISSSGQLMTGPVGPYNVVPSGNAITGLSYNKNTGSIALSSNGYDLGYTKMLAFKFNNNLSPDNNFGGTGNKFIKNTNPVLMSAKAIANLDNGSVILAGNSYAGSFSVMTLVKLKKDGSLDASFGADTGIAQIPIAGTSGTPGALAVLSNGKILVAGSVNNDITLVRLNADGSLDTGFNLATIDFSGGSTDIANSIAVQANKKIIVSGSANIGGVTYGIVMRFLENGDLDSNFGTNGKTKLPFANTEIFSSSLSVKDGVAYFVGRTTNTPNTMIVAKMNYSSQLFNILGKDIVSVSTENIYNVHPYVSGCTYNWSYSSTNIFTSNSITGDSITLYFKNDTPSGTLTCAINKGGVTLKTLTKNITVNPEPTLAEMLSEVKCGVTQTRCDNTYINSFNIAQTKLKSQNTGCSPSGYYDFTSSGNYDTLFVGDNYQAILECKHPAGSMLYGGVWIDFNNDGKINDSREFVGSTFSTSNLLEINNMLIPEDVELGPKRIRVRVSNKGPFTSSDFCPTNDTEAETEDYLIVLNGYEGIKTPNFITPNDDGKNDIFVVRGGKTGVGNSLKIFNRVGDLVYETDNYDNTWAGKDKNGTQLKAGTYYYVFTQPSSSKAKDDVVKGFLEIRY